MFYSVYLIYYLLSIQLFYKYVNSQSPEEDAPDCKVTFTFGYGYYTIFRLPETSLVGSELHMKFFVRAKSDAHILLSTSGSLEDTTPVYEIVLGAGKNTFSDIRKAKRALTKTTASTPNLLSANELREFWIRITHDGVIEVGKGNEDIPFMFWQDTDPLQIKYFSFSTWTDVFGKWFYDCNINKNETSAIVRKTVTWTDRLRADLLKEYDSQVIPKINFLAQKLEITVKIIDCWHIELDSKNSEIAVTSIFEMTWTDDKMNWEPSKYGGANTLQLRNGEIWQPELVLYNAVDHGAEPLSATGVILSASGEVMWSPTSKLKAHCKLDLSSWPWDKHTCKLKLGFWALKDFLKLVLLQNGTQMSNQRTSSIWQIQAIEAETAWIDTPWYNNDEDPTAVLPTDSVMVIKITVKRIASIYNYIFLVPLIVIAVVCVISFGLSPASTEKIGIQCVCLILGSMFIIVLDNSLPSSSDHVPYILKAFSESLIMVTISTAASVCVMTIIRQPHFKPPHKFLTNILSWSPLKLLFCLPEPNFDCLQKYDQLDQGEELTTDDDSSVYYWTVFATLLDRITLFITILFIFHTIFFL